MNLSIGRHACFKLGNNQEESLKNCDLWDDCEDFVEQSLLIAELLTKCKDESNIRYVKELLGIEKRDWSFLNSKK